jgi:hypothetical protein
MRTKNRAHAGAQAHGFANVLRGPPGGVLSVSSNPPKAGEASAIDKQGLCHAAFCASCPVLPRFKRPPAWVSPPAPGQGLTVRGQAVTGPAATPF